jgi:hypothetical protein
MGVKAHTHWMCGRLYFPAVPLADDSKQRMARLNCLDVRVDIPAQRNCGRAVLEVAGKQMTGTSCRLRVPAK